MAQNRNQGQFGRAGMALATAARRDRYKSVMFSSVTGGGGTTSAIYNVGRVLTEDLGIKTLAIEINRGRPSWCREFKLDASRSLAAMASGDVGPRECVQPDGGGLAYLPAGDFQAGGRPLDVVLCQAVQELQNDFEMILLDVPPVLDSADVLLAGRIVPRVVLVVESGNVPHQLLSRAQRQLDSASITVVGAILNRQKPMMPAWLERWLTR